MQDQGDSGISVGAGDLTVPLEAPKRGGWREGWRSDWRSSAGAVPLAWAGGVSATPETPAYVNLGDALSPVMVALVSGRPVARAPMTGRGERMAAIGTIGQGLSGGTVDLWGTGCSPNADPLAPGPKEPYRPPAGTRLQLAATRGPYAARLLSGGDFPALPYGDPALLLPRFHHRPVEKRCDLGVVLHLAELADRQLTVTPKPGLARYEVSEEDSGIRLITMVAPPTLAGIADKLDELRACRRIVSTSLHGIAIAIAYGIPCLYVAPGPGEPGLSAVALDPKGAVWPDGVNARFPDLYAGLGAREMAFWVQPKRRATDWGALIDAVDRAGACAVDPAQMDALAAACPAGHRPLDVPEGDLRRATMLDAIPHLPRRGRTILS
ncbi:MAG: polysaccharide pyruvyl transferase family protein [Pseudomonadota bacterium]